MKTKHKHCFFFIISVLFFSCTKEDGVTPNWPKKADFGSAARSRAVAFTIADKAYVGTGDNGAYKKDFWAYDPVSDSWQQKADFGSTARYAAVGFSIGSKGYVGLGYDVAYKSDLWEYDPSANTWTQEAFMPSVRSFAMAFVIGTKAYIGCGNNGNTALKDFWEYDQVTNAWTQKKSFPGTARYAGVGFSVNGKGYMGCGFNYYLGSQYFSDMYEYDPSSDSWTTKENFPTLRSEAACFAIGNYAYVGTGSDGTNAMADFYRYNPATDKWEVREKFTGIGRSGAVGFSIGSRGYICSGYANGYAKDLFEYWP